MTHDSRLPAPDSVLKIDAHQHFWRFDSVRDGWITEEISVIRRDFLPADLWPLLQQNKIDGCIAVQADQSETETNFLLSLAWENQFIKGVVGWVDLRSDDISGRLDHYSQFEKLKGFRHILQGEKDRSMMLQDDFKRGISALEKYHLSYDILIYADQLKFLPQFVRAFPGQKFVIDHLAKPNIKEQKIEDWKKDMQSLAHHENVYCKISGMVTEAERSWKASDFKPYLDAVLEIFGTGRIMYGSDWPVCLLSANYAEQLQVTEDYFRTFSKEEQEKVFGKNAVEFYNLG